MASVTSNCSFCGAGATLSCSRCKIACYCGPECQRAAWKAHKQQCVPAALREDAGWLELGGVEAIVEALRAYGSSDAALVRRGLTALEASLRKEGSVKQREESLASFSSVLVRVLVSHAGAADICTRACECLASNGAGERGAEAARRAGAVGPVFDALRAHAASADVCAAACRAIAHMSVSSRGEAVVFAAGAVPLMLTVLAAHAAAPAVYSVAMNVLGNIATESEGRAMAVADAGAVPILVRALRRHGGDSADVCYAVCNVLSSISVTDAGLALVVAEEGIVPLLLGILRDHADSAKACHGVCHTLSNLAVDPSSKRATIAAGALPLIVRCLATHVGSAEACNKAALALINISNGDVDVCAAIRAEGAVELLCAALDRHGVARCEFALVAIDRVQVGLPADAPPQPRVFNMVQ